ncbi:MAG: transporter related protein [Streptosporangiaceae bacterium]|nr:transporter related protein [Streptosporangiaceae bacterium]
MTATGRTYTLGHETPRPASRTVTAVEIEALVKRYGDITAVDGLSLTAQRGQVTALLGPNGAGKTTTIEICEGFRDADGGNVRVLGLDPVTDARALKPRVGVMPQSGGVPTTARAGEFLRLVASFYADPVRPSVLLERLGLIDHARTPYRRLSGGQQQRLSLATAIVGRPELVFLDEPTAGLDPQARHATWELIQELRAAGVAIVLTTHYMDEAERLADQVFIIDRGRVVANGTPRELTGAERQLRFRARPGIGLEELLTALPSGSAAKESPAGHYLIEGEVQPELLATVTAWCASHGVMTEDLRIERRTLEDVFLELTGRELRS